MKKNNRKAIVTAFIILTIFLTVFIFLRLSGVAFTIRSASKYEKYFGENGAHRENGLTESAIFPKSLPASAKVEKFVYRHEDLIDPSDAAVLVYICSKEDYEKEMARLKALETKPEDACGVYGITDFPCEVVAAEADEETGVIYVMTEPDAYRLIYVENTHCNYFSDIRYSWYIGEEYLPSGYDATPGNPVREAFEANAN